MPTTPNKPKLGADGKRVKTFVLDTIVSPRLVTLREISAIEVTGFDSLRG